MRVGIIGGTGPAGRALAARLASVGTSVVIGSRDPERAAATCDKIHQRWPDLTLPLESGDNHAAAGADLVIVATPWDAAPATAAAHGDDLGGKVVISMGNALTKVGDEFVAVDPPEGSVAAGVQKAVPAALVAAAFHHLPARTLGDLATPVVGDVLVCSDHDEAAKATSGLVASMPDLRALHAGSLAAAAPVEAFTAVLLGINARYRSRAAIRLTGIET